VSERRPKKRPNVFAQVVANADEVVQASFIAAAPAPSKPEAPAADATSTAPAVEEPPALVVEAFMPPRPPAPETAPSAVSVPKPAPEPAPTTAAPAAPHVRDAGERQAFEEAVAAALHTVVPRVVTDDRPQVAAKTEPEPVQPKVPAETASAPTTRKATYARPTAEPAAIPVPEAEAAAKASPRRRPVAARRVGQQHWSHHAVFESFASATIESKNWRLHGFRIVPDVLAQLKTRINADRRSTGNVKLAISHYLDAALRHASTDVDEQVALAQEFLTIRMGMVEAGKQSTYRVGPQASAWVADLNVGLQEADYGRKGIYVVSASIQSFLGALDDAGSLHRPDLPGVR
jgi:hypothetical protein